MMGLDILRWDDLHCLFLSLEKVIMGYTILSTMGFHRISLNFHKKHQKTKPFLISNTTPVFRPLSWMIQYQGERIYLPALANKGSYVQKLIMGVYLPPISRGISRMRRANIQICTSWGSMFVFQPCNVRCFNSHLLQNSCWITKTRFTSCPYGTCVQWPKSQVTDVY